MAFKPGGGETHAGARFILRSLRNGFKLLFHLKFDFYIALRPGEGARALRFALCPFPGAPSPSTHKRLLAVQMPGGI